MRIVITGASGNVGTALLRRLAEDAPGHDIVGVVRRPPEPAGVYQNVRWHSVDLAEPDAEAQGDAQAELVDSDTTLPEEDITRDED